MQRVEAEEFEALFVQLYPTVVRRLTVILHDLELARDLTQETYLRAYRARNSFDGRSPLAWIMSIGVRLALNETRRHRRFRSAFERLVRRQSQRGEVQLDEMELWDALTDVPPTNRAAIVLTMIEGYTYAEAAAILGVPPGTVGSWVSRGKAILRQELG